VLTDRYKASKLAVEVGPPVPWEKQFSRDAALQRAQRVFWRSGYERSSMTMLLKGMGIQKGSFYATFRSKHHVLVEALQLYIDQRFASFQALVAKAPPLVALRRHLDEVVEESTGPERFMGCFLVNCATELAPKDRVVRDIVTKTLQAHAAFYQSLLERSMGQGDLPEDFDAATQSTALLGLVLGMRVFARGGAEAGTIRALRQQAETILTADV
jgi:TetR/AcrR family transcriptional regulator, transcriptional repressor for nem operon